MDEAKDHLLGRQALEQGVGCGVEGQVVGQEEGEAVQGEEGEEEAVGEGGVK